MENHCKYCGNIGKKCPNKSIDGRCRTDGKINEYGENLDCEHAVNIADGTNRFLIESLYKVHNGAPRAIPVTSKPIEVYPDKLYCARIEVSCAYQSPGGKCTLVQFMEGRDASTKCDDQIYLDKEPELITRLIQFVHRDVEQLKKEKAQLQKQIEELQQNQK